MSNRAQRDLWTGLQPQPFGFAGMRWGTLSQPFRSVSWRCQDGIGLWRSLVAHLTGVKGSQVQILSARQKIASDLRKLGSEAVSVLTWIPRTVVY